MTLKTTLKRIPLLICLLFFIQQHAFSQCFQIESILVDACGVQEGLNEMVRLKVGSTPINTTDLSVSWPNNPWQGLVQNAVTASKVATLNADILDAGGCGQLIEPTGGILPANATVILVTSFNFDTDLNSFGPLTDTIYILFQNNPSTASGHFANSGAGLRTLTISFGSCTDTVTYDRSLLIDTNGATVAADGAIVLFNPAGVPTYINNGCSAPVPAFTVDAGPPVLNACAGATLALSGSAQGAQTVLWSAPGGSFSNTGNLSTNYIVDPSASGNIALTLTATNSCGATVTDVIMINIGNGVVPNFATALTLCTGSSAPVLNTTSPNGIIGIWNPAIINNTSNGTYIFTPNAGQCASNVTLNVTVTNSIVPNFATALTLCTGSAAPVLNTTSPNGIVGIWNPATINNTSSGTYIFTPNAGQCAGNVTLNVTVTNSIVPDFATAITLCTGSSAPVLNTTSPNGIVGIWNPAIINNTSSGTYIFTPNAGQCAGNVTLNVTVTSSIIPNFATALTLCIGSSAPVLNTTSPNGIIGIWNPAIISNTSSGTYIFTPNAGQCASNVTLNVTVTNSIVPNFATALTLCTGSSARVLNTTSPNGIVGIWNPATINNTTNGAYIFTPNAGQCAGNVTLNVTVTNSIVPDFATAITLCTGSSAPVLNTTSPNGIVGIWNPSVISNTSNGAYIFTPNSGQCAANVTLSVAIQSLSFEIVQDCNGGDLLLQTFPVLQQSGDITYEWTNDLGNIVGNDSVLNVTDLLDSTTISEVFPLSYQLTIASGGCSETKSTKIYGIFCGIPKGISPNGDNKNDAFDLTGLGVKELSIYNRYGTKVYGRTDYTNQWSGQTDNGNELPDATYYYVITINTNDIKTGWVYINR